MAQDDSSDEEDQWRRFQVFWQGVGVNVVANLFAAAILYPVGVLFGLLPRNPAAILTAAFLILLALMVTLSAVSRARRLAYRLRERAWLAALLVGISGLGVGAYIAPEDIDRWYFAFAAVGLLAWWIGVVREYRRGVPVHVIMSKNPRRTTAPIENSDAPASGRDLPVGERWRAWRAAYDADSVTESLRE